MEIQLSCTGNFPEIFVNFPNISLKTFCIDELNFQEIGGFFMEFKVLELIRRVCLCLTLSA